MEDLTDVVHQALDNTDPPWGGDSSTFMGLGPKGLWLLRPKDSWGGGGEAWHGMAALRSSGPQLASGGWDPVALSGLAWRSGARDASRS
jgi:hypothetical protein